MDPDFYNDDTLFHNLMAQILEKVFYRKLCIKFLCKLCKKLPEIIVKKPIKKK